MPRMVWGFTIIEMTVVVALVAVLSAGAAPFIVGWLSQTELRGLSDQLSSQFYSASMVAEAESLVMMVGLDDGNLVWKVAKSSVECSAEEFSTATLRHTLNIPSHMDAVTISPIPICIYPNGRGSGGTIDLSTEKNTVNLRVNSLGGVTELGEK